MGDYFQLTGRVGTKATDYDLGGQDAILFYKGISDDNFIPVEMDQGAGVEFSPMCSMQCFARSYEIAVLYMQLKDNLGFYDKRIILARVTGDEYDFDQERTDYTLSVKYIALGW